MHVHFLFPFPQFHYYVPYDVIAAALICWRNCNHIALFDIRFCTWSINWSPPSSKSNLKRDFLKLPKKKLQKSNLSFSTHNHGQLWCSLGLEQKSIVCQASSPQRESRVLWIFENSFSQISLLVIDLGPFQFYLPSLLKKKWKDLFSLFKEVESCVLLPFPEKNGWKQTLEYILAFFIVWVHGEKIKFTFL